MTKFFIYDQPGGDTIFEPHCLTLELKLYLLQNPNNGFLFLQVFKHFQLTREMKKNLSADELARMASKVLAACLCVPLPSQHPEFDRWETFGCFRPNFSIFWEICKIYILFEFVSTMLNPFSTF